MAASANSSASSAVWKVGRDKTPKRETLNLAGHAPHRVAVVAVVVVLGVQVTIRIEVQVVRVVVIVNYRRPVVGVATNTVRIAVPVAGIGPDTDAKTAF